MAHECIFMLGSVIDFPRQQTASAAGHALPAEHKARRMLSNRANKQSLDDIKDIEDIHQRGTAFCESHMMSMEYVEAWREACRVRRGMSLPWFCWNTLTESETEHDRCIPPDFADLLFAVHYSTPRFNENAMMNT